MWFYPLFFLFKSKFNFVFNLTLFLEFCFDLVHGWSANGMFPSPSVPLPVGAVVLGRRQELSPWWWSPHICCGGEWYHVVWVWTSGLFWFIYLLPPLLSSSLFPVIGIPLAPGNIRQLTLVGHWKLCNNCCYNTFLNICVKDWIFYILVHLFFNIFLIVGSQTLQASGKS